jgi:hypothetical protein
MASGSVVLVLTKPWRVRRHQQDIPGADVYLVCIPSDNVPLPDWI